MGSEEAWPGKGSNKVAAGACWVGQQREGGHRASPKLRRKTAAKAVPKLCLLLLAAAAALGCCRHRHILFLPPPPRRRHPQLAWALAPPSSFSHQQGRTGSCLLLAAATGSFCGLWHILWLGGQPRLGEGQLVQRVLQYSGTEVQGAAVQVQQRWGTARAAALSSLRQAASAARPSMHTPPTLCPSTGTHMPFQPPTQPPSHPLSHLKLLQRVLQAAGIRQAGAGGVA